MILTLFAHQWKNFWRSRNAGRNVAIQILMGFLFLYLFLCVASLGFFLDEILIHLFPGQDLIAIFCGFILYYFFLDIMLRFMLQDLPTLSIYPYLPLNISRKVLARFLNLKSLFSIFNILPIVLFFPFIIKIIGKNYSAGIAICFAISIIGLLVFNHFTLLYLKRKSILNSWWMIGVFVVVILLGLADWFGIFSLRSISASIFIALLHHPYLVIIPVILAVAAFFNNNRFVLKNLYIDEGGKTEKQKTSKDYSWLARYGNIGELMSLDIKLILRNKRPRSLLVMSVLFLAYGFIYFKPQYLDKNSLGLILFGSVFVTGMFVISYGQFLFAWHSSAFDGLMVGATNVKDFIKSKFRLMQALSTVALCICLLYGFMSWKIIPVLFAAYCFNIGIVTIITGYFATLNYKALDLSKSGSFNYQGSSSSQWLYSIVVMLIATVLYLPLGLLVSPWAGIFTVALVSIICVVLQDKWIDLIYRQFLKNKYKILEGFRAK